MNYANADTIAHTANFNAGMEAVTRARRARSRRVVKAADNPDTLLFITADHGNIEVMIDRDDRHSRKPHDPSPVPLYLVAQQFKGRKFINGDRLAIETLGSLADVAPTILALMGIPKPEDMGGTSLLGGLILRMML